MAPNPDGSALFPVDLDFELFAVSAGIATVTGVLAALFPAARAARLDPAEAMLRV
jgi:lipoprotein-releasing system permease protein